MYRKRFALEVGPLELDWDAAVGMRLNEQVLHEWDIAEALDPSATLPDDSAELVIDNLDLIARFTAEPHGERAVIAVATTRPDRAFAIVIEPDTVIFSPATPPAAGHSGPGSPDEYQLELWVWCTGATKSFWGRRPVPTGYTRRRVQEPRQAAISATSGSTESSISTFASSWRR